MDHILHIFAKCWSFSTIYYKDLLFYIETPNAKIKSLILWGSLCNKRADAQMHCNSTFLMI